MELAFELALELALELASEPALALPLAKLPLRNSLVDRAFGKLLFSRGPLEMLLAALSRASALRLESVISSGEPPESSVVGELSNAASVVLVRAG